MTNTNTLPGFATEVLAAQLLKQAGAKPCTYRPAFLWNILKSSRLGCDRVVKARPYLVSEYVCLANVPADQILDRCFGIDAVVNFGGTYIAIDITANPNAIAQKQRKLESLRPLWSAAKIDRAIVLHITRSTTAQQIAQALTAAIASNEVLTIAL